MREPVTRRGLLARAAVAAPAVALPAVASALPAGADPHPAWLAGILAKRDLINTRDGGDEETDALFEEMIELEDRLYETPARTLAGVRA